MKFFSAVMKLPKLKNPRTTTPEYVKMPQHQDDKQSSSDSEVKEYERKFFSLFVINYIFLVYLLI